MEIKDIIRRRSDLSTFLVHLTRDGDDETAKERLKSILTSGIIEARSAFGHAIARLQDNHTTSSTQNCVCFTETPLEYVNLLLQEIDHRTYQFKPYGIAITKKEGRRYGVNPIWYVDITPSGHPWLSTHINNLINEAIQRGNFDQSDIAAIAPFIEQMGRGRTVVGRRNYRKEFWWEREWRHRGNFALRPYFIGLCPENEIEEFRDYVRDSAYADIKFIDPNWSLEQIIAQLAGIPLDSVDLFD